MGRREPIFLALSPNVERDDVFLALKTILRPGVWLRGKEVSELEKRFREYLGAEYCLAFNSGRAAFLAILEGLDLQKGDEVLIQGFTCNALVNPIRWKGLTPVYVDLDTSLNMDPDDLKKKITGRSRMVVVQHTFGQPAQMNRIRKICEQKSLILIEDCAHSLGASFKGRRVGKMGRASFFSLGRDKVVSSVYGGMAVTNDEDLAQRISSFRKGIPYPSFFWVLEQLLHPVLCEWLVKPLYGVFGSGRWVLGGLQRMKILSKAVHKKEKKGRTPIYIPAKMPNALAVLGVHQFDKLERFVRHQRMIAEMYYRGLEGAGLSLPHRDPGRIYMRYPVLLNRGGTDKILKKARKEGIFLDDGWRITPVVPYDTDQERMEYRWGECPNSERTAQRIINLPTHINMSRGKAERIICFLKKVLD